MENMGEDALSNGNLLVEALNLMLSGVRNKSSSTNFSYAKKFYFCCMKSRCCKD
jgi:hypothetical protein